MRPIGVYLYLSLAQPIVSVQSDHSGILHRVSLFNLMHTTPTRNTPGQSPNFDKLAFRKYMKNIGRAYQKQAMELVSLSRTFVQAQEQSSDSDAELGKALQVVDDALRSAAEVKNKTSEVVDKKFEMAIEMLGRYETAYHPKDPTLDNGRAKTVRERMEEATTKDKSSSGILNTLKEKLRMKPALDGESEPTTIVEFLLFKSLPDNNPTIVKQELSKGSKLTEILWNFARYKDGRRLTLSQNPHFYKDLPRNKDGYRDDFQREPTEDFSGSAGIFVLTDRPGRVYLESDQNARAFGNVWAPSKAMIFKDVCGKLEGESHVQESIQAASRLWYLDVPPLSPTSLPVSPNQSSPTVTSTSVGSSPDESFEDWREPIRRGLDSPDTHICVRAVPPSTSSSIATSPSSPTPFAISSGSIDSPVRMRSIARPTPRSARPKAGSPTSGLSPRAPAPAPSTALPEPSSQQHPIAASPLATTGVTISITPTSRDEPQKKLEDDLKVPTTPDIKHPTTRLSGNFTSPQVVSSLPRLLTADVEVSVCFNKPSHVDRGSNPALPQALNVPQYASSFSQLKQLWIQRCNQAFGR
ncbi:hypothetical protein BC827DRAFT_1271203 [Russula dissimulans]|nr:hypothetical protein BC827DRAFT_1271203 [Russula dissimulans]